jgi:RimJ/RimL family protein N-acetyltransferase
MDACLRPVLTSAADAARMAKWRCNAYQAFFTWIRPDPDEMLRWLEGYQARTDDIIFFIEAPCGVPIGQVSIYNMDPASGSAEFGRLIRGENQGPADLIFCACRSLLGWVFDSYIINRVVLEVFADNHKAVRLYKRLGFGISGTRIFKREADSEGAVRWMKTKKMAIGNKNHVDTYRNVYRMELMREQSAL